MATLKQILAASKAAKVETTKVGGMGVSNALSGKWAGTLSNRKGASNELRACSYLLSLGYDVFRNVSSDGPADIIAVNWNAGKTLHIDVKSAGFSIGNYEGQETLRRAKEMGIALMVMGNDDLVTWYNPQHQPEADQDNDSLYDAA